MKPINKKSPNVSLIISVMENWLATFMMELNSPITSIVMDAECIRFSTYPHTTDGKKYKTVTTVTPHTHILSANSYELEILRLLAIFAPQNVTVCNMLEKTRMRLKTTCFGKFCDKGECFESSVVVLRFIGTAFPNEISWIKELMDGIKVHMNDKKRHSGTLFYYWLCLSEMPLELAITEIERYKGELLRNINRSFVMNSEHDNYMSPLYKYLVRNCLARLGEYAYIKDREPFQSEKDGRLHFHMG